MKNIIIPVFLIISSYLSGYSQADIYPVMQGTNLNPDFSVRINDGNGFKEVPVQDIVDVCFVHFALKGNVQIEITVDQPVETYRIGPANLDIAPAVKNNKMTFELTGPAKVIVLINEGAGNHNTGLDGLCILADVPEVDAPKLTDPDVINIAKYNVDTTGNTVETNRIQQVLDEYDGMGKIIYFPPGIYKSGMLHVRNNQSLYLAPGAVILGSSDYGDYARIADEGSGNEKYLIGSWKSNNIKVFGRGIVNGNGTALRLQDPSGAKFKTHNIQFQGSKNVHIEGIISLDAASWNMEMINCDSVVIKNSKLMSDLRYYEGAMPNTDGIDINKCRHVLVDDCLVWAGDDAITPKQDRTYENIFPYRDMCDHIYRNIVVYSRKCAVKIGDETMDKEHEIHDMLFENFDVVLADRVCCIWSKDGALIRDITFRDFRIEELYTEYQSHIHFRINDDGNSIQDINFINISAKKPAPKGSSFIGNNLGNTMNGKQVQYDHIHFSNYTIGGKQVLDLNEPNANFQLKNSTVGADPTAFSFN